MGAFAVAIHGAEEASVKYQADHDDFSKIMMHALADRCVGLCLAQVASRLSDMMPVSVVCMQAGGGVRGEVAPGHPARVLGLRSL